MPVLYCVIPVYNEPATLERCVDRVLHAAIPAAWSLCAIMVDDASDAETRAAAGRLIDAQRGRPGRLELLTHLVNRGKGAALRTGFRRVLERCADENDAVIIQDADLEYDPTDFEAMLTALPSGGHAAVFGDRWSHASDRTMVRRLHRNGNKLLTRLSNMLTGYRIGDMECCYKLLPIPLLRRVLPHLTEDRFGIEPQLTAALAREGAEVIEVPVHYDPRGFAAGKKIGWRDGVRAMWVIVRERMRRMPRSRPPIEGPARAPNTDERRDRGPS